MMVSGYWLIPPQSEQQTFYRYFMLFVLLFQSVSNCFSKVFQSCGDVVHVRALFISTVGLSQALSAVLALTPREEITIKLVEK